MISGYAWSDNIGWIKFGGLSSFPTGSGTTPQNAQLEYLDYGAGAGAGATQANLVGWARACAGTANGDCSTMQPSADGWDGWISLNGSSLDGKSGYSVSLKGDGVTLTGYAWGSDVVGWIDFDGVTLSAIPVIPVTINYLNAASSSISTGNSTTISWSSTGADTCSLKIGEAPFNSGSTATSGSATSGSLSTTTTFFANCTNSTGGQATAYKTVVVTVLPVPPPDQPNGSKVKDCVVVNGIDPCNIIWEDTCTFDAAAGGYDLSCIPTNPPDPENPGQPKIFTISPDRILKCNVSQPSYTGESTTWSVLDSGVSKVRWSGTLITPVTAGNSLSKTYSTVGKKTITAVAIIGNSPAACSTSTIVNYTDINQK
jgi:hypothetical protein